MLKKTITYIDYNDEERTEDHYFHLTKAELLDWQMSVSGGMQAYLNTIMESRDNVAIYQAFREIFVMSYGVKSPDGRQFVKNDEVRDAFFQSEAWSEMIMEVMSDPSGAAEIMASIVPKDLRNEVLTRAEEGAPSVSDEIAQPQDFKKKKTKD